ncbi:MAG TPA: hypothetical protein VGE36_04590 [Roseateles sp.]
MLKALKKLRPQQQNTGAGSVQVGKAGRDVQVVNVHQVHQHFYASAPQASPAPAPAPRPVESARVAQPLTDVHREALALMEPLPKRTRIAVLDFMSREFGTRMVKELHPAEAHRVRLYVRQVRENRKREAHHEFL